MELLRSQATHICNTANLITSAEWLTIEIAAAESQALFVIIARNPAWPRIIAFQIRVEPMANRIIAVSILGVCAIVTVAWTTFLGWGLYELFH